MNILLINGSPKGKRSNSLKLANSFIEGLKQKKEENGEQVTVCEMDVAALKIGACRGCFSCWQATPGECCIKDDMPPVPYPKRRSANCMSFCIRKKYSRKCSETMLSL